MIGGKICGLPTCRAYKIELQRNIGEIVMHSLTSFVDGANGTLARMTARRSGADVSGDASAPNKVLTDCKDDDITNELKKQQKVAGEKQNKK